MSEIKKIKVAGVEYGINDEKARAIKVDWDTTQNVNDYTTSGVYDITGIRRRMGDNLPITNVGENASFAARLIVSVSPEGTTTYRHIVGQTLILANAEGHETKVYTRSGNRTSYDGGALYETTWGVWNTLQTNINVGQVDDLDSLTDNGIYSGVWTTGSYAAYPLTFVCITINDYFVGISPRRISQFVYGLSKFDGSIVYQSRVGTGDSSISWSDWEIVNEKVITQMINSAIAKVVDDAPETFDTLKEISGWIAAHGNDAVSMLQAIQANADEIVRIYDAVNSIKGVAARYDGSNFSSTANEVRLKTTSIDTENSQTIVLPSATTETAGVMSAEDKRLALKNQYPMFELEPNKLESRWYDNGYLDSFIKVELGFQKENGNYYVYLGNNLVSGGVINPDGIIKLYKDGALIYNFKADTSTPETNRIFKNEETDSIIVLNITKLNPDFEFYMSANSGLNLSTKCFGHTDRSKIKSLKEQVDGLEDDIESIGNEIASLGTATGLNIDLIGFPAREDGSDASAGYYKGYEVVLEGLYFKGYRFIKFRASSYRGDTEIRPGIIYDNNGNVEHIISVYEPMSVDWYILPITENSKTLRASYGIPWDGFEIDFIPYKYELLTDNDTDERITQIEDAMENVSSSVKVFLPHEIYILKGRLTQLFFRGFIKAVDPYVYDIKVQCNVGKTYKRYYEIEHNTVGDFPLKIEVRDNDRNVLGVAETIIKVIEPQSISAKNILCCGASATVTGHWAAELKRLLTTGSEKYEGLNLPMTFVGRKSGASDESVQLEATGGWTWDTFIRNGDYSVRFNITSLNGNIGVDTKLTFNDPEKGALTYTVQEVNLTDGVGNIRCAGDLPSVISGTLTGESISIVFDNVAEESFIPFYNSATGNIDFKSYADRYCNGKIDVIITHLGVNSVLWENSVVPTASIKDFLNGYFKDFPDGKVVISAIPSPDYGTNVYANAYKDNSINRYGTLCAFLNYDKALYEISMLDEYKGKVVYCPSNMFFDTDYGYPKRTKDVNTRITAITEQIDTNGVHPIKEGSYLIADSILTTFVSFVV